MKRNLLLLSCIALLSGACNSQSEKTEEETASPNVLLIYTDDLGYGDLSAYGGDIPTPNIDKLAAEGILFTNAYATAATCTPSRYSLLTGEYAWRAKGRGVAPGDASALIKPGVETLPGLMKKAGYRTAVIGKWHLGLGGEEGPDWNGKISPGPLEIGFDYSFILPATGDRVPTVYVEDHHIVNLDPADPIEVSYRNKVGDRPTGKDHPEQLTTMWSHGHNHTIVNGVSRIGYMSGGEAALWRDEDFADIFVGKATQFIKEKEDQPFFMYFATHDIHVPRLAHERFQGITNEGPRGDVIAQLDWTVGALMDLLEKEGMRENTIVVFTSDNGPVLDDGYEDQARELLGEHKPWGELSGGKYSALEAGTRVPFIVRWPQGVSSGQRSAAMFSQVDLLGSFASYLSIPYDQSQAIDTQDSWAALIGEDNKGRDFLVQEALFSNLALLSQEGYKYIPANNGPAMVPWGPIIKTGFSKEDQLFDLNADPKEQTNIANEVPEKLAQMKEQLENIKNK